MLTQKNYTHIIMQTVAHEPFPSHFRIRLPRFLRWFINPRKENPQPLVAEDFTLGNERFAENGYYQVATERTRQERTIDTHSVNLLLPFIR